MEEFHESSVVLPLGKYHSTSTIASSRLRLAAVRGAVYPPGYRYLCDLLFAFVWARYVVGSCLQRALVSRTRPSPTRSSGRPSRSMLSRSIPEGCFLKPMFVHRLARLLYASFRPRLAATALALSLT